MCSYFNDRTTVLSTIGQGVRVYVTSDSQKIPSLIPLPKNLYFYQ